MNVIQINNVDIDLDRVSNQDAIAMLHALAKSEEAGLAFLATIVSEQGHQAAIAIAHTSLYINHTCVQTNTDWKHHLLHLAIKVSMLKLVEALLPYYNEPGFFHFNSCIETDRGGGHTSLSLAFQVATQYTSQNHPAMKIIILLLKTGAKLFPFPYLNESYTKHIFSLVLDATRSTLYDVNSTLLIKLALSCYIPTVLTNALHKYDQEDENAKALSLQFILEKLNTYCEAHDIPKQLLISSSGFLKAGHLSHLSK